MGRANKAYKMKRRTRDLDQILGDDLKDDKSIISLKEQKFDEDKPGLGQYYCIPCARYFETEVAKRTHGRGKVHRRRLKQIKEDPYTQEEADFAAGHNVEKYLKLKEQREQKQKEPHVQEELARPPTKSQEQEAEKKEQLEAEMDIE